MCFFLLLLFFVFVVCLSKMVFHVSLKRQGFVNHKMLFTFFSTVSVIRLMTFFIFFFQFFEVTRFHDSFNVIFDMYINEKFSEAIHLTLKLIINICDFIWNRNRIRIQGIEIEKEKTNQSKFERNWCRHSSTIKISIWIHKCGRELSIQILRLRNRWFLCG